MIEKLHILFAIMAILIYGALRSIEGIITSLIKSKKQEIVQPIQQNVKRI